MIFYLPVLAVLYIWAMAPGNKIHGGGFAVLLILTAAGAASELWLNPWFLHLRPVFKENKKKLKIFEGFFNNM